MASKCYSQPSLWPVCHKSWLNSSEQDSYQNCLCGLFWNRLGADWIKKSPLQSYFADRFHIKIVIFLIQIMWQPSRAVQCLALLTSVFLGQVVSHLPVVIAVQDAVGDADMVGSHLMNALRDADDRRWGRGPRAPLGSYRTDWRRARGHRWWSPCAPEIDVNTVI